MKQIPAWEATDGTQFFTAAECRHHERTAAFTAWHKTHPFLGHSHPIARDTLHWLTANAEDIRGFLPPVETAKPELDIEVLRGMSFLNYSTEVVSFEDVEDWLAGELK